MALPRKIKNLNLFLDGNNFVGVVQSFTPPKLARKMEAYRGGGMNGAVNVDQGMDDGALDAQWTLGGIENTLLRQYGATGVGGILMRFTGAAQRDDTGEVDAIEIVLRGRHKELDLGEWKPGESAPVTIQSVNSYYKLTVNGQVQIEVDLLNMVEIVDGVDRLADQRRAIGL